MATVTVVDVVFGTSAFRMKQEMISAEEFFSAVNSRPYVPPVLPSEQVGAALVFPFAVQNTSSRSPLAGVIATDGFVPVRTFPAATEVRYARAMSDRLHVQLQGVHLCLSPVRSAIGGIYGIQLLVGRIGRGQGFR